MKQIIIYLATILVFGCCTVKKQKRVDIQESEFTYKSNPVSYGSVLPDTLMHYKSLWNQKYGSLKQKILVTPFNVSSSLWNNTMQKFQKNMEWIVPRLTEDQSYINILNHPELKTKEDFEKCCYNILPFYRETANAMDFIDTTYQDYGNYITLDTTLHLITIERDGEILAIFSHIDLTKDGVIDRSFTNDTQNPFRTDKILTARNFSDTVFAVISAHTDRYISGASICFAKGDRLYSIEIVESVKKMDKKTNKIVGEEYKYAPIAYLPVFKHNDLKTYFKRVDKIQARKKTILYNPQFIFSPEQVK